MGGSETVEVDLAPAHLVKWLEDEIHRAGQHGFTLRASREWSIEPVEPSDGDGLDPEDELAAHTAYGTLEVVGRDGGWRLTMEVVDPIGCGTAPDWPPIGDESDGPQEVTLATFAETFGLDDLDGTVTLFAADPGERRKAERLIARILADTHRR